ncbi:MFS transporter [Rhodovulum sulfidophilum]|uniref:MFS transporter n=1 Tax=Rhodovulum sulfidophilum TaxID=35806 RepID=UPI000952F59C|nr:MFS transporter [Rhodovulum sulfidophilum]MBL3552910.1 MFS transporter [Rhodovulum sulfidophilum]OLS50157.1 MFS transporter [Rhodovulum sulfidophilum]
MPAAVPSDAPAPAPQPQPTGLTRPLPLAAAYMLASMFIALSQSLGQGFLAANIPTLAGELGATQSQTAWLMVAFMAPRASLPLMLIKIRSQYGLRRFAEVSIALYAAVALLSLLTRDLRSALLVELLSGISAAPLATLAFLYALEPLPQRLKLTVGLPFALSFIALGMPLARAISPTVLTDGGWTDILLLKLGMAMVCLFLVFLLPLPHGERTRSIRGLDLISFALIAASFGGLVACFTTGYIYWWTAAAWMGPVLALSIAGLVLALVIELHRTAPLLDVRWLATPEMLHLTAALLIFRVILSEQTAGAPGLFRTLGFAPEQIAPLFWGISLATLAGGAACALVMKLDRVPAIHVAALLLIALGSAMDAHANTDVSPTLMIASQAMVGFAAAMFLPSAMAAGLVKALSKGPQYLLSFVIVFLSSQILGGTVGAGLFRTFVAVRTTAHSQALAAGLQTGDPLVAARLAGIAAQLSTTVTDPVRLKAEAVAQLAADTARQATVSAYNDVFALISALALCALAALLGHIARDWLRARMARRVPADG